MNQFLYEYNLHPTTWVYLSSLLVLTVYFKFSPLIRWRNVDMIGLVAIAPGLVLLGQADAAAQLAGYLWLLGTGIFFLIRMLADPRMVRRPLLEPNLNTGGLTFLGAALLVFLSMHMATGNLAPGSVEGMRQLFSGLPAVVLPPGSALAEGATRVTAIVVQLFLVTGLVLVGHMHFRNVNTGIGVATLALMLPSTALAAGRIDLVLPGALLVWMTLAYRRPYVSGMLLGAATCAISYPLFLLPLWCGFYWQRGLVRFVSGFTASLAIVAGLLYFTPEGPLGLWWPIAGMFGWAETPQGLWGTIFPPAYRIPTQVAFVAMCVGFALWPVGKNLGTLLSCSTAVMLGTQFWQLQGGGTHLGWYLPLLLLTVFRPNLDDRVALTVLGEAWLRPKVRLWKGPQAA
jgi:hypothetical protein